MVDEDRLYVYLIAGIIVFTLICLASLAVAYCRKERHSEFGFIIHTPTDAVGSSAAP